jgi:hypothetical protein
VKMRRAFLAAVMVAAALPMSACVPAVKAETQADAARSWELVFELSGGFAGMAKQMTISHDGRLVAENLRRRVRVETRLSEDRMRELHRLIGEAQSGRGAARDSPGRCADCMQYRLTVRGPGGRPALSEGGSLERRQSGSPELIEFLVAVLNETIQP